MNNPFLNFSAEEMASLRHRWHLYQAKVFGNFGLKPGDKVIDVGCGFSPFPFANYAIDTLAGDSSYTPEQVEHYVEFFKSKNIVFWQTGLEGSDFTENYFEFAYASHILEHVNDPVNACMKLMAMARRGYIETPSLANEILMGDTGHKWNVFSRGNKLIFRKLTDEERMHPFGDMFYRLFNNTSDETFMILAKRLRRVQLDYPTLFYNMFYWEEKFEVEVWD